MHGQVALADMQIGPTDSACAHPDQQFVVGWARNLGSDALERVGPHRTGALHSPRGHGQLGRHQRRGDYDGGIIPGAFSGATGTGTPTPFAGGGVAAPGAPGGGASGAGGGV